ncbi:MAG: AmmeMemoRadiSam system protein B [Spirochaetales bacterium]|nr:AmmeMemoRadiSam system protein B [Spirochaetales bacterium]
MKENIDIRQPIVEGLFYPSDQALLDLKIESLLDKNSADIKESCKTIIVPHGGWDYTGDYIARGFNSLKKENISRVIIISNVHREFSDNIYIPQARYFQILDNKIKLDLDSISKIEKLGKKVLKTNVPHMEEHGIECILPFVYYQYPQAKIVPILLGKTIVSLVRNLSNILLEIADENSIIIISSNFSGYEKEEFSKVIGEQGVSLVIEGKMGELIELTRTNKLKTCGAGAIASILLYGRYSRIKVFKQGLTEQTPLSGGKATYYGTLGFLE